jgi:ABC-type amino acid transport substrate-binding protein
MIAMGLRDMVDIIPIKDAKRTILGVALSTNEITPEDLRRLQLGLEAMRQDGTFLRILARWVGDSVARDQLWRADRDAAMDTQP